MLIIETTIFTRRIAQYLTDELYRRLQQHLIKTPEAGAVIPGSGGLRELRWADPGQGKRGGLRIIYYWVPARQQLLMLFVYPKSEQDDLTTEQLRLLKRVLDEEYP